MRKLMTYHPVMYRGMSYEQASRKAAEVCEVAAESGQTDLVIDHLVALAEIRRCVPPRTESLGGGRKSGVDGGAHRFGGSELALIQVFPRVRASAEEGLVGLQAHGEEEGAHRQRD